MTRISLIPVSPSDSDALTVGESVFGRRLATGTSALTSGGLRLTFFTARKTETITSVRTATGGTAAAGTTLARLGVYREEADGSITLLGSTANDVTLFSSASTSYTRTLTAPFPKVAGVRYAVGVLVVATTPPSIQALSGAAAAVEASVAPRLNGTIASLSDLPTTSSSASVATGSIQHYFALLP